MIVIDSSAFSKFLLREEDWEEVASIIKSDLPIYAVEILVVETTNVIWKYLKLFKKITKLQAIELYDKMVSLITKNVVIIVRNEKVLKKSLTLSITHDIPIYDSLFLALTKFLNAELITSDKKQNKIAREMGLQTRFIE